MPPLKAQHHDNYLSPAKLRAYYRHERFGAIEVQCSTNTETLLPFLSEVSSVPKRSTMSGAQVIAVP